MSAERWRKLRTLAARRPELAGRVGYNGLAQLAPVLVVLALTPLLLDRLGLDRFGIWSLALIVLNALRLLDGGIAQSLARFYAIHAAADERREAGRLLIGSWAFLGLIGVVLTLAMYPLAPTLADLLDIPPDLTGEATVVFRWIPGLAALALIAESTAAVLVGHGRFKALAAAMWASAAAFAVAVIVFVGEGAHLETLMIATALRFGALFAVSLALGARHVSLGWPPLPARATAREVGHYSSRMQVSALTGFVNWGVDGIVIAAVVPVKYVGLYQIGLQVASAVRSLPLFAFAPLLTRLTTIFRIEGRERTAAEFERLERSWFPGVFGYGMVAVGAVGFSVPIWLGDDFGLSGAVAAVLLAGYTVHVGLTGMRTCYVRAIGRPGLETRCSAVWTVVNIVLTVPLALLFGTMGVVSATAFAGVVASVYFVALCRREEHLPALLPDAGWWLVAALATTVTVAGEIAIFLSGIHGFGALLVSAIPALIGWAIVAAALQRSARGVSLLPAFGQQSR
jgi:O-antigen/teichoic acid export membrane protein